MTNHNETEPQHKAAEIGVDVDTLVRGRYFPPPGQLDWVNSTAPKLHKIFSQKVRRAHRRLHQSDENNLKIG